jgi:intracellular multiplication protein IcmP
VVVIAVVAWWMLSPKIASVVLGVRGAQAWALNLIGAPLSDISAWIAVIDRREVTLRDMYLVSDATGWYTRFVGIPVLAWVGWRLMKASPTERFKRRFTDVTLPKLEAELYPWVKISVTQDLSRADTDSGAWAMAQTERQFVRMHGLRKPNGELDADAAELVLIKQIGALWMGYRAMRSHSRGLFAMMLARIERDYDAADALLIQMARTAAVGKPDITGADEIIKRHKGSLMLRKLVAQHAYERTLMMSMLVASRGGEGGKDDLPPNFFLWLKGVERPLWYALADVGRRAPHVESAGVFAHWLAERARMAKIEMPFVATAVTGLSTELDKYLGDDEVGVEGISLDDDLLEIHAAPLKQPSLEEIRAKRDRELAP